ncbi:MAG: hypothetical protein QXV93_02115 [Zestosphaera sp.]
MSDEIKYTLSFEGYGEIEKVLINIAKGLAEVRLSPQDLSDPVSFQIAVSRMYDALMKAIEGGGRYSYVAKIRFVDSLGNNVSAVVDLGEEPPPFASKNIRARITVELYEE